jgi:hypothetical protein
MRVIASPLTPETHSFPFAEWGILREDIIKQPSRKNRVLISDEVN